jgi:DegV family protein with EDD domain
MKIITIIFDTTCDMSPEVLTRFNITYVKMGVSIDDKEYDADLAWEGLSSKEFYDLMRAKKRPYTIQVKEDAFVQAFNKYLDMGNDILYIGCSSGLSASVKLGAKVAEEIMQKRPGSKIIVVDPLTSGMAQGLIGIKAAEMRDEGKSVDEIAAWIEKEKLKFNEWATVGSLTYLKNAGRVKAGAAFFGNIIGIKPILISDAHGHNIALKKVRGRQAALQEIADSVIRTAIDPEHNYLAITHADCPEDAQKIADMIAEKIHFKEVFISHLGPILGASCGPETVMAMHYGEEVTVVGE